MADKETVTPEKKQKTASTDFSWKKFAINLAVKAGEGVAYTIGAAVIGYALSARKSGAEQASDNVVAFNNKRAANS